VHYSGERVVKLFFSHAHVILKRLIQCTEKKWVRRQVGVKGEGGDTEDRQEGRLLRRVNHQGSQSMVQKDQKESIS